MVVVVVVVVMVAAILCTLINHIKSFYAFGNFRYRLKHFYSEFHRK